MKERDEALKLIRIIKGSDINLMLRDNRSNNTEKENIFEMCFTFLSHAHLWYGPTDDEGK